MPCCIFVCCLPMYAQKWWKNDAIDDAIEEFSLDDAFTEEEFSDDDFMDEPEVEFVGSTAEEDFGSGALMRGFESYRNKDWLSSVIFLRQALNASDDATAEVLYMLIMSEMYSEDYEGAVSDCDAFLSHFPASPLVDNVRYQKGRSLHYIGQNDESVLVLSDFCHENPDSGMYPSALYVIAECFYDDYNFDTAHRLYEQLVADYPDDAKAADARFTLDAIAQREREQKLLLLLKTTGEEYVSARENYERQLREYETEDIVALRRQLNEAYSRISDLEAAESEKLKANLSPAESVQPPAKSQPVVNRRKGVSDEELLELKVRASQLQRLLDEKYSGETNGNGGKEKRR